MLYDEFGYDSGTYASEDTAENAKFARQQDATSVVDNAVPVVSDTPEVGNASVLQKLGSIDITSTARNAGAIVGSIAQQIKTAGATFNASRSAASSGNSIALWWQYASMTDKLVVGLAALGIIVVLVKD